mmetsp:Transcript_11816/g.24925  ORF Transcript_11816/g.24925 Transcript_11816/m.24925 type:complete len:746 (-) Transcript_11816:623-2860(-)
MTSPTYLLGRRLSLSRHHSACLASLPLRSSSLAYFSSSSAATQVSSASSPSAVPKSANQTNSSQSNSNSTSNRRISLKPSTAVALTTASLLSGYCLGTRHTEDIHALQKDRALPSGELRGCCSCDSPDASKPQQDTPLPWQLTEPQKELPSKLSKIVGREHVLDGTRQTSKTSAFLKGTRLGRGAALCIVQPGSLREAVDCLKAIVDADCVVIPQGANTGLTGGSVPRNNTPDTRPPTILSLKRLTTHFPIDDGQRVLCLAGCGISTLATSISTWFPDRESHSILGSTFLNPTTAAGIAFGSGGVYLRKGPARTDRALYCKVSRNKFGENEITVVNTLGVEGLEDGDFVEHSGEDAIGALDVYAKDVQQGYRRVMAKSSDSKFGNAKSSDSDYQNKVCENTGEVSRYNADTSGEDCNRSEGKVLILATVHDTFPAPTKKRVFWVSFPDMETTLKFRREVCLNDPKDLPISCEYLDRDSVDIIDRSGRILTYMIRFLGMGDLMGYLWRVKCMIEGMPFSWAPLICDKTLHVLNNWVPEAIPSKFMKAGREWDHHAMVAVGDFGDGSLDCFMERLDAFVKSYNEKAVSKEDEVGKKIISVVEAESEAEVTALNAFRFVAATAFKVFCVGEDLQGVSVDYALPKNGGRSPPLTDSAAEPIKRMRYSHFGCNVVHEDLAYALGVDTRSEKLALKHSVEDEGGKLPAEHGHGTEYNAPDDTKKRWMSMDPLNVMNPGVGGLNSCEKYAQN